jgi:hypothetical protein
MCADQEKTIAALSAMIRVDPRQKALVDAGNRAATI